MTKTPESTPQASDQEQDLPISEHPVFDAVTFDTNVFYKNEKRLDQGLLAEFDQYRDRAIQVVISEVVVGEILRSLKKQVVDVQTDLHRALRVGQDRAFLDRDTLSVLQKTLADLEDPEKTAQQQMELFLDACAAEVVSADGASMSQILQAYFSGTAPFSGEGKKHEFPDAVIVSSLTRWAEQKGMNLLAVSKDKGLREATNGLSQITVMEDLGSAMTLLLAQSDKEESRRAEREASALWEALNAGDEEHHDTLMAGLRDQVAIADADIDISSSRQVDVDMPDVQLVSVMWDEGETPELVNANADGFVFRIEASLTVRGRSTAYFSVFDSIDKDYVPMGSMEVEAISSDTVSLLFQITIDLEEGTGGQWHRVPRIAKIDISGFRPHFDYGDLEVTDIPGWHD